MKTMEDNNIGYTFWPYKKLGDSCMMGIERPEGWDAVVTFSEGPRATYAELREAKPDRETARKAMAQFIELCKFKNCKPQENYIKSIKLK